MLRSSPGRQLWYMGASIGSVKCSSALQARAQSTTDQITAQLTYPKQFSRVGQSTVAPVMRLAVPAGFARLALPFRAHVRYSIGRAPFTHDGQISD
jgi:hypothetical protein